MQEPHLTAFESREDGMFVLSSEFDPITGNRIALAISDKERELWRKEDPKKRRTPQQRMADALAELILEPKSGRPPRTALLVIADYDAVHRELINARLCDGTPIAMGELRRLASDADILPGVFRANTQKLWLGRKRRIATEAQRAALALRDKGCIGCDANPAWCQAHHIQPWSQGGPTNLDNLVLVCGPLPPQHPRRRLGSHQVPRHRELRTPTTAWSIPGDWRGTPTGHHSTTLCFSAEHCSASRQPAMPAASPRRSQQLGISGIYSRQTALAP